MEQLLSEIRACTVCKPYLEAGPRPIVSASPLSKLIIIGQAPGSRVHKTGVPWDDPSGVNLRKWLGLEEEIFYNPDLVALIPMGFCYPGKGKSGDLPPRPECAPLWHQKLWEHMPKASLTLLVGQYAQKYYLGEQAQKTLTARVKNFTEYLPQFIPLPHPSPRNNIWQKKNPWFGEEVLPILQKRIQEIFT